MPELGLSGAQARCKRPRTTVPGDPADRPAELLERRFDAYAPNRRWVIVSPAAASILLAVNRVEPAEGFPEEDSDGFGA